MIYVSFYEGNYLLVVKCKLHKNSVSQISLQGVVTLAIVIVCIFSFFVEK